MTARLVTFVGQKHRTTLKARLGLLHLGKLRVVAVRQVTASVGWTFSRVMQDFAIAVVGFLTFSFVRTAYQKKTVEASGCCCDSE